MSLKLVQDAWYELWEEARSSGGRDAKESEDNMNQAETNRTKRTAESAPRRKPGPPPYWLVAKSENSWIEVLTLDRDGEEILPVFSHEEEAVVFLRLLRGVGEDWRLKESRSGELISLLYGPCAGVKEVALDPLPEMVAERTVGLVSLDRERFIESALWPEVDPSGPTSTLGHHKRARASGEGGTISPAASTELLWTLSWTKRISVTQGKKTSACEKQDKHKGGDVERAMLLASLRA
jgi:hypothetical protein